MNLRFQNDCTGIDFNQVPEILKIAGMGFRDPDIHQKSFTCSASVVFVFDNEQLIGFGRAISDGCSQAAIYDVAVLPPYQGKGIGRQMIGEIVDSLPGCSFILYASPGKEPFYEKLHFKRMKTAMALFVKADIMRARGFTE